MTESYGDDNSFSIYIRDAEDKIRNALYIPSNVGMSLSRDAPHTIIKIMLPSNSIPIFGLIALMKERMNAIYAFGEFNTHMFNVVQEGISCEIRVVDMFKDDIEKIEDGDLHSQFVQTYKFVTYKVNGYALLARFSLFESPFQLSLDASFAGSFFQVTRSLTLPPPVTNSEVNATNPPLSTDLVRILTLSVDPSRFGEYIKVEQPRKVCSVQVQRRDGNLTECVLKFYYPHDFEWKPDQDSFVQFKIYGSPHRSHDRNYRKYHSAHKDPSYAEY